MAFATECLTLVKRFGIGLIIISLGLIVSNAYAQVAVIELEDEIAGPAVHVHTTQLFADGAIVFQEYNLLVNKDHDNGSTILCKLPEADARVRIAEAQALTHELPRFVNPGSQVPPLDGSDKTIIVRNSRSEHLSNMPTSIEADSIDAHRFLNAWKRLEQLLSCSGA